MAAITGAAPGAEHKRMMFGAKSPQPMLASSSSAEDIARLAARLKISEERYSDLRKKLLLVEQNMLSNHKKALGEIKIIHSDITDVSSRINDIQDKIMLVVKELKLTARREDVDVMKKYVELWNPMRFVTRDQVENILKDLIDSQEEAGRSKQPNSPKDL